MKPDRPLLVSILTLVAGLWLILGYCHGTASFNAAYPFSGSILHIDLTTTGPGVVGGVLLIAAGLLLLAWAAIVATMGQIMHLGGGEQEPERLLE